MKNYMSLCRYLLLIILTLFLVFIIILSFMKNDKIENVIFLLSLSNISASFTMDVISPVSILDLKVISVEGLHTMFYFVDLENRRLIRYQYIDLGADIDINAHLINNKIEFNISLKEGSKKNFIISITNDKIFFVNK